MATYESAGTGNQYSRHRLHWLLTACATIKARQSCQSKVGKAETAMRTVVDTERLAGTSPCHTIRQNIMG